MPNAQFPIPLITLLSFTLYLFDFSEIYETDALQVFDSFLVLIEKPSNYVIIFNVYLRFLLWETLAMSEPAVETPVLDRYECRACGYIYEPEKGDDKHNISSGIPFAELPINWRCPVCTAKKTAFANIGPAGSASGFKANLGYGLGVNQMTPGQKNILIFGALALAFLFFISLYGLQ
jgi:rubredoxin